eukprot:TRINITY_DN47476_c0_g1_i1.p2 TRINITY_DN47476_c0_g1~~TRINITY_DN47476_c0_g1_i1.p2  ORF type:complete len:189 (+),score=39.72 TRINITY_DN47476_c0_g1_i1:77-643(+)
MRAAVARVASSQQHGRLAQQFSGGAASLSLRSYSCLVHSGSSAAAASSRFRVPRGGQRTSFDEAAAVLQRREPPMRCVALPQEDSGPRPLVLPAARSLRPLAIVTGLPVVAELQLPSASGDVAAIDEADGGLAAPLECAQHKYRRWQDMKQAIKYVENASRADCGPKGKFWRWYRDRKINMRKKKRCI